MRKEKIEGKRSECLPPQTHYGTGWTYVTDHTTILPLHEWREPTKTSLPTVSLLSSESPMQSTSHAPMTFHIFLLKVCSYATPTLPTTVTVQLNLEKLSTIVEKHQGKSYIMPLITFQYSNLQFKNINLYHYRVVHEAFDLGMCFCPGT